VECAKKEHWSAHIAKKDPTEEQKEKNTELLKESLNTVGGHLIQNLFGIGTDSEDAQLTDQSVAGRIQLTVGDLAELSAEEFKKHLIDGDFKNCEFGSTNGKMNIKTRNPLDKITNAAKEGGLHSFMELSKGNEFSVFINIINPTPKDFGFIALWEQGIETGLLRLGGLTSIGRGRLTIKSTDIKIFLRDTDGFVSLTEIKDNLPEDVLSDVFKVFTVSNWKVNCETYLKILKDFYENYKEEGSNE